MILLNIITLILSLSNIASAKPPEGPTPEAVCQSITSDKYVAQCTTIIKDGYYDPKASSVCLKHKNDYEKKSCMEVIRGKDYTQGQLDSCQRQRKVKINMCLKLNGELRKVEPPKEEPNTAVEG